MYGRPSPVSLSPKSSTASFVNVDAMKALRARSVSRSRSAASPRIVDGMVGADQLDQVGRLRCRAERRNVEDDAAIETRPRRAAPRRRARPGDARRATIASERDRRGALGARMIGGHSRRDIGRAFARLHDFRRQVPVPMVGLPGIGDAVSAHRPAVRKDRRHEKEARRVGERRRRRAICQQSSNAVAAPR